MLIFSIVFQNVRGLCCCHDHWTAQRVTLIRPRRDAPIRLVLLLGISREGVTGFSLIYIDYIPDSNKFRPPLPLVRVIRTRLCMALPVWQKWLSTTRGATIRGLSDDKRYSRWREVFPMIRGTPDDKRHSRWWEVFSMTRGTPDDKRYSRWREVFPMIRGTPDGKRYSWWREIFSMIRGASNFVTPLS